MFHVLKSSSLLILIFLASCHFDQVHPIKDGNTNKQIDPTSSIQDQLVDRLSRLLASRIAYPELRDFLRTQALRKIDGDYNMLLAEIIDKAISNDQPHLSFRDVIQHYPTNNTRFADSKGGLIDSLLIFYPLLQISIPQLQEDSVESWNIESHIPLIAVLDSEYDDMNTESIRAYHHQGFEVFLSNHQEPENLVIVLSSSERISSIPTELFKEEVLSDCDKVIFKNSHFIYYIESACEWIAANEKENVEEDAIENGRMKQSCRSWGKYDYLYQLNCSNTCKESWARGAPEIFVALVSSIGYTLQSKYGKIEPPKRKDIMNKWYQHDARLFQWSQNLTGPAVYWIWWEQDGGASGTYLSHEVYIQEIDKYYVPITKYKDDHIGHKRVQMDDCELSDDYPAGHIYQSWEYEIEELKWRVKIWSN